MTRRFCLIGERAGTSLSPVMHNAAFRARGIDAVYEGFDVAPEQLPHVLAQLRSGVYAGCNVTMPYKAAVVPVCDWVEGDAELLGVVNTITVEQGKLIGQNTDAEGFELALSVQGLWPVAGSTALILGAGGAAAAVALALLRAPAARMVIAARRTEPAVHLAERVAAGEARTVPETPRPASGMVFAGASALPATGDTGPCMVCTPLRSTSSSQYCAKTPASSLSRKR